MAPFCRNAEEAKTGVSYCSVRIECGSSRRSRAQSRTRGAFKSLRLRDLLWCRSRDSNPDRIAPGGF